MILTHLAFQIRPPYNPIEVDRFSSGFWSPLF